MRLLTLFVSVCSFVCFAQSVAVDNPLRIGAFNLRTFGQTKISKILVAQRIAKIVSGYDVLSIQGIRDISGQSVIKLFDMVTELCPDFGYVMSDRLGRTPNYKEQYAFFYRTDRVYVKAEFQYDDGPDDGTDIFSREPFCVLLQKKSQPVGIFPEFTACVLHAEPDNAPKEIDGLIDVYEVMANRWGTPTTPFDDQFQNAILMGDFAADGVYLTPEEENNLLIKQDPRFLWVIDSDADTATNINSDNAYDRILIAGADLIGAVVNGTGKVHRFDLEECPILTEDEVDDVSDHYPVEVSLQFN